MPSKRMVLARSHNSETARRVFKKTFFDLMHELNGMILDKPPMPKNLADFKFIMSTHMRLFMYHIWTKLITAFDHYLTESDRQIYMAMYRTLMENIHEMYDTITVVEDEQHVQSNVKND